MTDMDKVFAGCMVSKSDSFVVDYTNDGDKSVAKRGVEITPTDPCYAHGAFHLIDGCGVDYYTVNFEHTPAFFTGEDGKKLRNCECMFSSCYAMSAWLDNEKREVKPGDEKDKSYFVTQAVNEHSALRFVEQADDATKEKLRTVKWFFDCGDEDFLFDQSVKMHQLMRAAWIRDELRIRNGVHNWEYWHLALRMALPFASRNFVP